MELSNPAHVALTVVAGIAVFFLLAALVRWLWNTTMTDVFGLRQITYWQAFRLLLLSILLFGGLSN